MKETGKARVSPVCDFVNRVGKRHRQSPKEALLGQREPPVDEQSKPDEPKKDDTQPLPRRGRGKGSGQSKAEKKKAGSQASENFSADRNISPQNQAVEKGVKKEQVKGCGSVNRPTPGSQRPAEPVASGFLRGVKIQKIRGRFEGLGVKLWVVDAGFSQRRAIPYGVKIGVAAISCCEQGKQSARLSAEHNWRG